MKPYIISSDYKDNETLINEFIKVIKKLGGRVYQHPDYIGSDTYGFIVSENKMTKHEINNFKFNSSLNKKY